jgi:ATP-dependent DNA helicase PIF1
MNKSTQGFINFYWESYALIKVINFSYLPKELIIEISYIFSLLVTDPVINKILKYALNNRNIILHGPGGVGKSFTIRQIAKELNNIGKKVHVTATTGVAAVNLSDSELSVTTLHSFAGVGTALLDVDSLIKIITKKGKSKKWKNIEVLIIDEISMMGGTLFTKLDLIAKTIRKNNRPFGGIQLIVSGDFLQLPPVKDNWVFFTEEWKNLNFKPFILEIPFRYNNIEFFQILLRIRKGIPTQKDYKILRIRTRANLKLQTLLDQSNYQNCGEIIKPTMFYSKRCDVEEFNKKELGKLMGKSVEFTAVNSFITKKGSPKFEDYMKLLDDNVPQIVSFKVGAQVMLRINLDTEEGLVNGSRGVVCEIKPDMGIIVKFLNGKKVNIQLYPYIFEDKYALITRIQIPLVLAYAMTIHRAQGSTLDYAVVDLGSSIFTEGQAYVAISRCRDIRGLFISSFTPNSIMANKEAILYCKELEDKSYCK